MNLTKGLASLVEMQPLETNQEGLLRGGFAMITTSESSMGAINTNCDCDCDCDSDINENCNCRCRPTAPPPTQAPEPAEPTGASGRNMQSFGMFSF